MMPDRPPHTVSVCSVSWCWPRLTETSLIVRRTYTHSALCVCHKAEMLCGSSKWKYFPFCGPQHKFKFLPTSVDKLQAIFCRPALALFQLEQPMTNSLVTQHNCGEWWRLIGWDSSEERYPTDVCDMRVTILLVTNWTGQATARNKTTEQNWCKKVLYYYKYWKRSC